MNLILNINASGGSAKKKWEQIKYFIYNKFNEINIIDTYKLRDKNKLIKEAIAKKNNEFIIAGGDGTVNYFVNNLIESFSPDDIKNVKIGVVGIGSSNDFCKPYTSKIISEKIPCKIDFKNTQPRDVGVLRYKSGSKFLQKYFLLNASIGVTAEANNYFNKPDALLRFLKQHFTQLAIIYAAIKTIFLYKNSAVQIIFNSYESYSFPVSNLSIVKNPNISGDLSYPGEADYKNGLFDIYLAHSMNKIELINLLKSLGKKIFPNNQKTKYCRSSRIKLKSDENFLIEYDGEIISTNYAEFSILNKYLNICEN